MSGDIICKNEPLTVLARNGRAYLKVTTGAIKAMGLPSAACVLMCGKYLEMTASQSKSMLSGLEWSSILGRSSSVPRMRYVRTVTMNGQPAWEMSVTGEGTAYVGRPRHTLPTANGEGSRPHRLRAVEQRGHRASAARQPDR